jgi:hypothetical protein
MTVMSFGSMIVIEDFGSGPTEADIGKAVADAFRYRTLTGTFHIANSRMFPAREHLNLSTLLALVGR